MSEPMTVKELVDFLEKNCNDDDYVYVDDEGCETNLYEENIICSEYGVTL